MSDLTECIARAHHLNPHDFGCSCGEWTYRPTSEPYAMDIEGHLIHVADVTEAAVREQVGSERALVDQFPRFVAQYGADLTTVNDPNVRRIGEALVQAARLAQGYTV